MKRHLKNIVLTAGLSVLLGSSTLNAQDQKATANIPFAYHVGEQTFSPGKYTIGQTQAPGLFVLRQNGSRYLHACASSGYRTEGRLANDVRLLCRPVLIGPDLARR